MAANQRMSVRTSFLLLHLLLLSTSAVIIDQSKCPNGWQSVSEQCVRLFHSLVPYDQAEASCAQEGAELLNIVRNSQIDKELIHELNEPIENAREFGVDERTWWVGSLRAAMADAQLAYDLWLTTNRIQKEKRRTMDRKALALQRTAEGEDLTIMAVAADKLLPFICVLLPLTKLRLLYEQAFMPTGAPKFIQEPSSSYHYVNRADGHFITLPCRASGDPEPKIRWFRSGIEEIDVDSPNSTFVISGGALLIPIGKQTAATEVTNYHCTAGNKFGTIRSASTTIRPAFIDPFRPSRLDAYPLSARGGGARLDCQAPNHYPKTYAYSWMTGGLTDQYVTVNERIFISRDGTLHFSYACTLASSSSRGGQYGPFFRLVLPQGGEAGAFAPVLDEYLPQVFPEVPVRGETVWIECFAYGFPAPTYKWERIDGLALSSRHHVTNFGRVLRIENVEPADATRYRCSATNERGTATAPVISRPLSDLLVATGSTVRFSCPVADSQHSPVVYYEWLRNGAPLVPVLMAPDERRRFRLHQNELAISDVRPKDAQVYQCRISNEIGTTSSTALLTVRNSPPLFHPNVFPRRVFVLENTAVRLPCLFYAVPRGSARWQRLNKENNHVDPALFDQVDENGVILLVIDSFTAHHQGDYECRAVNEHGESRAVVQLVLMTRPKVSISQALKPDADGESYGLQISCEAELECASQTACPEAHFNFAFNERKTERMRDLRVRQFARSLDSTRAGKKKTKIRQHASVDASSAFVSKNVGRFACSSVFGGATAELEPIGGVSQLASFAPTQLRVLGVDANSAKLSWRLPPLQKRHESLRIDGFQVERRTVDDKTWRPHSSEVFRTGDRIIGSFLVRDLRPNAKYQFRVRTRSVDGALSLPSAPSAWIETPPAAPDDVVRNLRWKVLDTSHLLLEWQPIEQTHHSGPNLRYNVTWAGNADGPPNFSVVDRPSHIIALRPGDLQRDAQTDCAVVAVGVQPLNDLGSGPIATDTVVYVSDQAPKRRAFNLRLETFNATHLNFTWAWADAEQCENVRGALISCADEWEDGGETKPLAVTPENAQLNYTIAAHSTEFLVGGLLPWTQYRCSIVAVDQHGRRGPQSDTSEAARTAEPPPRDAPTIRRVKLHETLSGFTTLIDWTAVRLDTALNSTREQRGYFVYVFISESAETPVVLELRESEIADVRWPSARIDGLKLMFLYRIEVAGFNRGGVGPRSAPTTIRIGAPDPPAPDSSNARSPSAVHWITVALFLLWRAAV